MEELLQEPTDGVRDAIVVTPIIASQFELKIGLLNLVTTILFHGAAQTWLEKEPPNSITTWNDLVSKFVNRFFPHSRTTNLRNEITTFQQRFVNSITTRSGLTTAKPSIPPPVPHTPRLEVEKEPETLMDELHIPSPASTAHVPPLGIQPMSPPKPKEDPKPNPHQPKIPYPSRLNKTKILDKNDVQVSMFLKILKQLHFDISLMDAITQIPKYHKVLKDLLKDKEKLAKLANTPINVECFAILLNKVFNFLADSGASIKLMPLSIYEKLGIGPLKPTRMTLELANRSADPRVPIILGRPFLRTVKALVDLYEEKLTLRIGKKEVVITSHSNHSLPEYESFCFDVDHIEEKSSGSTTSHSDLSLLEYESFHFYLSIDPLPPTDRSDSQHEEFADELTHIISPPEYFLSLADPSETDTFLSFPSGNEDKVFDPGILITDGVFSSTRKAPLLLIDNFMIDKCHLLTEISLMTEYSIPSGESKVHIEVLSVLWENRLPILDGSLPLFRYKGLKTEQKRRSRVFNIQDQDKVMKILRACHWKEHEKTSPTVPSLLIGPAQNEPKK
ncbi:reverse transcriptase domain-containing protein [Tanacetum coccineum]